MQGSIDLISSYSRTLNFQQCMEYYMPVAVVDSGNIAQQVVDSNYTFYICVRFF